MAQRARINECIGERPYKRFKPWTEGHQLTAGVARSSAQFLGYIDHWNVPVANCSTESVEHSINQWNVRVVNGIYWPPARNIAILSLSRLSSGLPPVGFCRRDDLAFVRSLLVESHCLIYKPRRVHIYVLDEFPCIAINVDTRLGRLVPRSACNLSSSRYGADKKSVYTLATTAKRAKPT